MAAKRLLVLGAGPAQLGALAAARRRGIVAVAVDADPLAPGFRYAARRALLSLDDEPGLDRLARAERIDGVLAPGSDRFLATAARVAAKLGLPHPLTQEAAQRAAGRERERDLLAAAGVEQPDAMLCHSFAEVEAAAAEFGFPCRIDPVDRQAGLGATTPRNLPTAVAIALAESRSNACIVERIPTDATRLTVLAFLSAGVFRPVLVAEASEAGPSWPAPVTPTQGSAAVQAAARAARALGVTDGPLATLIAFERDRPLVLRAAPRLAAHHEPELCRVATGVDLNGLALSSALGLPTAEHELTPRSRVAAACVRFFDAPAGRVVRVDGVRDAFASSGVRGVRIYHREGSVLREGEHAGAVLAVGNGVAAAEAAAERALRSIRVETVRAQAA